MSVEVVSEPRVYALDSPHSYFRDVADLAMGDYAAEQRLQRHATEVRHTILGSPRSAEGRRVLAELREQTRSSNEEAHRSEFESRAGSTSSASFGAFVTPQFVVDQWASFRGANRAFTDQTTLLPLPEFGMEVHIPGFVTAASAGVQASGENTAPADVEPTSVDLSTALFDPVGQVNISQQLHDRGFHGGGTYDLIVGQQLKEQLDESVDRYVLQQAIQAGVSVAGSAAATFLANFYGDVAAARGRVNNTAGTRLRATHVFTTSDLHSYVTRQFDNSGRPLVPPTTNPTPIGASDSGWTGLVLPGLLGWFCDDLIPASGSNTRILVSRPDTIATWEGAPTLRAIPQTLGGQLSVLVQLYQYVASIPRYPSATAYVSGNSYPTSLS
jgi:hypothetical protein